MKIEVKYNYKNVENSPENAGENERKEDWVKRYAFNIASLGDIVSKQNGTISIDFINTESELEYYPDVKLTGFCNTAIQLVGEIAM